MILFKKRKRIKVPMSFEMICIGGILLCFFTPALLIYFEGYSVVYLIIKYSKCVISVYLNMVLLIRNKGKVDKLFIWGLLFSGSLLLSSILGDLNIISWINTSLTIFGIIAFCQFYGKKDINRFLLYCLYYFLIMLIINDVLMFLYPTKLFIVKNELGNQTYHFLASKNSFSMFFFPMIFLAHICYECNIIKKSMLIFAIILAIIPSIFSISITSISAVLLFEIILILVKRFKILSKKRIWIISLFFFCVLQLLFTYIFQMNFIQYIIINYMHKDSTLSGRAMIWEAAHEMIKNNLFLGKGNGKNGYYFYCIVEPYISGSIMWAHNTSLDLLVQGGICLFISFYGIVKSSLRYIFKTKMYLEPCAVVMVATFLSYTVMGFTERLNLRVDLYLILAVSSLYKYMINRKNTDNFFIRGDV